MIKFVTKLKTCNHVPVSPHLLMHFSLAKPCHLVEKCGFPVHHKICACLYNFDLTRINTCHYVSGLNIFFFLCVFISMLHWADLAPFNFPKQTEPNRENVEHEMRISIGKHGTYNTPVWLHIFCIISLSVWCTPMRQSIWLVISLRSFL